MHKCQLQQRSNNGTKDIDDTPAKSMILPEAIIRDKNSKLKQIMRIASSSIAEWYIAG